MQVCGNPSRVLELAFWIAHTLERVKFLSMESECGQENEYETQNIESKVEMANHILAGKSFMKDSKQNKEKLLFLSWCGYF